MDSVTYVLSLGINIVQLIVQTVIYTQALTGYQLLQSLLDSVMQLESDVRLHCSAVFTFCSMRWRFHKRIDAWLMIVCVFLPQLTYTLGTTTLTTLSKCIIVFCSILIQMKGVEYCVWAQMIQELLHLVQQQLIHLKEELVRCERMELRCSFFAEIQANQKLLARVWDLLNRMERYFCIPICMLFFYNGLLIIQTIHWSYINFELDDLKLRLCKFFGDIIYVHMLYIIYYYKHYLCTYKSQIYDLRILSPSIAFGD